MSFKTGRYSVDQFPALSSLEVGQAKAVLHKAYKRTHGETWYRSRYAWSFLAGIPVIFLAHWFLTEYAAPLVGDWVKWTWLAVGWGWLAALGVVEKRSVSAHIDRLLEEPPASWKW